MYTEVNNVVYEIKLYDHKMGKIKSCYLVNQDLGYKHGYRYGRRLYSHKKGSIKPVGNINTNDLKP